MRAKFGLVVLCTLFLDPASPALAGPTGTYGYVVPTVGYTIFDKELLYPRNLALKNAPYFGGRLGWQLIPGLALEAAGGYVKANEDTAGGLKSTLIHGSGNLVFSPFMGDWGGPFVSAGFGLAQLKSTGFDNLKQGNLEAAAGFNFWLSDQFGVRLEARDLMWLPKEEPTKIKAHDWIVSAGLTLALGGQARDGDADGVVDRQDKCPNTPKGAIVDATGCPKDSDGDGVYDGIDQCPNTPSGATVDARGCPTDSDNDGVFDGIDQCPNTPTGATVDAKGCPTDADKDGVMDGLDQCANTPTGCVVDEKGCPKDADGDGVCDGLDDCPGTAAGLRVDAKGCPIEVKERETELLDTGMIRLQDINFETAKADLLPESLPRLDIVGQVLANWPELKIEIGGHTDSRGTAKYNQRLSEARAKSVSTYLVQKFNLKPAQFTERGYGESKPLVPNTSPLNMAKNRRVEFVVLNRDVLKKAVERRRLLKQGEGTGTTAPPDTTRR